MLLVSNTIGVVTNCHKDLSLATMKNIKRLPKGFPERTDCKELASVLVSTFGFTPCDCDIMLLFCLLLSL